MELDTNKAGMSGLDKNKINALIAEASRGSKFEEHQSRVQKKVADRVAEQKRLLDSLSDVQIADAFAKIEEEVDQLERSRDLSRVIVHLDMDAFYAAVEMRDHPALRDVPMAVGSTAMLSTSNYAARRFGVRAAMPGFIAVKLCPQLTIVPCDLNRYKRVSQEVERVIRQYDPSMHMAGLDEAYFDLTTYCGQYGAATGDIAGNKKRFWYRSAYAGDCQCWLPRLSSNNNSKSEVRRSVENCKKFRGKFAKLQNCKISRFRELDASQQTPSCNPLPADVEIKDPYIVSSMEEHKPFFTIRATSPVDTCPCGVAYCETLVCSTCGMAVECWRDVVAFGATSVGDVVEEIRFRIHQQTGLTASAGIAANEMLAKICSDQNKPNGQFYLERTRDSILEFVSGLPVRKIPGVGKVTEQLLSSLGIKTCGDLFEERGRLRLVFKPATAGFLLRAALGLGSGGWSFGESDEAGRKSISNERTFAPTSDVAELNRICRFLCDDLYGEITTKNLKGKNVAVKLKTDAFDSRTRSITLPDVVTSLNELTTAALRILNGELKRDRLTLRLLGRQKKDLDHRPALTGPDAATPVIGCPVCGRFTTRDPQRMNVHVDCLTRSAIRDTIAEFQDLPEPEPPAKKHKQLRPMDKFVKIDRNRRQ